MYTCNAVYGRTKFSTMHHFCMYEAWRRVPRAATRTRFNSTGHSSMAVQMTVFENDGGYGRLPINLHDGRNVYGRTCIVCARDPYSRCGHVRAHPLPILNKSLREWRIKTAALRDLPPYIFMLESFLPVIVQRLPRSVEELRLCTFVDTYGTSKAMVDSFLSGEGDDIIMLVDMALADMAVMPLVDMSGFNA